MEVWRDLKEQTWNRDSNRGKFLSLQRLEQNEKETVFLDLEVSRRSHLAETVVLEKEASNVVPKSVFLTNLLGSMIKCWISPGKWEWRSGEWILEMFKR